MNIPELYSLSFILESQKNANSRMQIFQKLNFEGSRNVKPDKLGANIQGV